jgi:misacylated tRNA(Ala) deacylase
VNRRRAALALSQSCTSSTVALPASPRLDHRRARSAWIVRIDFKLDALSAELCAELAHKVNAVIAGNHAVRAYYISEDEFRARGDLLRTLDARPPIANGRVRVVEIAGFDAQACGGTHVATTSEVGRFAIVRTENKGKINKRLYVRLDDPMSRAEGR